MKTRVMDMNNPDDLEAVQVAYYVLFTPDLQCVEQKLTPEEEHLKREDTIVVAAFDEAGICGVCMVDDDSVLYPVMRGSYVDTLTALIKAAYEANGNYLKAYTQNELILETAVEMGIGVTRDGYNLEFK